MPSCDGIRFDNQPGGPAKLELRGLMRSLGEPYFNLRDPLRRIFVDLEPYGQLRAPQFRSVRPLCHCVAEYSQRLRHPAGSFRPYQQRHSRDVAHQQGPASRSTQCRVQVVAPTQRAVRRGPGAHGREVRGRHFVEEEQEGAAFPEVDADQVVPGRLLRRTVDRPADEVVMVFDLPRCIEQSARRLGRTRLLEGEDQPAGERRPAGHSGVKQLDQSPPPRHTQRRVLAGHRTVRRLLLEPAEVLAEETAGGHLAVRGRIQTHHDVVDAEYRPQVSGLGPTHHALTPIPNSPRHMKCPPPKVRRFEPRLIETWSVLHQIGSLSIGAIPMPPWYSPGLPPWPTNR